MLGQPVSMLIPQVVGFRLDGELPEGATATDLVLTVTEMLRKKGVVGKFVEFFGAGLADAAARRPRDDRQHGPGVRRDLRDLPDRRRDAPLPAVHRPADRAVALVEAYAQGAGDVRTTRDAEGRRTPTRSNSTSATSSPSLAGPKPPAGPDAPSPTSKATFAEALPKLERTAQPKAGRRRPAAAAAAVPERGRHRRQGPARRPAAPVAPGARRRHRHDGRTGLVVIAAITSCTNTSNPSVMIGAGLLAKKAVERGLDGQALGQDGLAPGLEGGHRLPRASRPHAYLDAARFNLVGYGCTTCIGNWGPLPDGDLRRSRTTRTWSSARCYRATATSRAGSTRT